MPLVLASDAPTMLIRKAEFERVGLSRAEIDRRFNLTPDEFRVEGELIAIGPLYGETVIGEIADELEALGLVHFDDFFDISGNWPEWLTLYGMSARR